MTKRTKALQIPPRVKRRVYARDGGACVLCGAPGDPVAHVVPRSHGGLGIEENVVTLCRACHTAYDQSIRRPILREAILAYLKTQYANWDAARLIYRKEDELC